MGHSSHSGTAQLATSHTVTLQLNPTATGGDRGHIGFSLPGPSAGERERGHLSVPGAHGGSGGGGGRKSRASFNLGPTGASGGGVRFAGGVGSDTAPEPPTHAVFGAPLDPTTTWLDWLSSLEYRDVVETVFLCEHIVAPPAALVGVMVDRYREIFGEDGGEEWEEEQSAWVGSLLADG
ncbi:hypothetical protein M427DRAFT_53833 [Gonapodya prolifera JEL478]|uniref:Uncharacterized protein n=1 Tax=Gonapodya prolifera (strain JEL478) TaxID=1344416 RepID=A0A139APN7_GONPJ|nr:hypothetical protein M427DRAFT_53833 [Gonapodya prolifera JEL478]|eukprot:KXS18455.1 hypothetical protein M427DRAFT_53833 [Gonapodya prolifera JEL478]